LDARARGDDRSAERFGRQILVHAEQTSQAPVLVGELARAFELSRKTRDLEAQLDVGDVVGVQVAEEMDDVEDDAGDERSAETAGREAAPPPPRRGRRHAAADVRRHQQELRERHDPSRRRIGTGG
jgi:hypothetical protein